MRMKRVLLSVLMLVVAVYAADAQNNKEKKEINACTPGHYIVFDVGGGLHTLAYNVDGYGTKNPGAGLMVRGGYRYFFSKNWGVGTELNYKSYLTTFTANYGSNPQTIDAVDEDGKSYKHITEFHNLKERETQHVLSLPVAVYFQQRLNNRWKVGGGVGAVAQFELVNKFKTQGGDLETKGYYDIYNVTLYGMEQHHFYTKSDFSGDAKKRSTIGAMLEGNALFRITERLSLDLGVYMTFAFGYKNDNDTRYLYDPDCKAADAYKNERYNGALGSQVTDRAMPIAIGGMAGIRYRIGKDKQPKKPDDKPIDKPVDKPDSNLVVVVPVKDTVPEVVVVDVPETPVVDTTKNDVPEVVDVPTDTTTVTPVVVADNTPQKEEVVELDLKKYTRVNVNFGLNEAFIKTRPDLKRMLDEIADVMTHYPDTKLHVTGHTCNIGSLEKNMELGQRRAEAFKNELVKRGVDGSRITCVSKAYLEPLFPNTTEANREKNRRVEFTLSE